MTEETRTYAVVGDSRGIGAALRERLLVRGDRVIGISRSGVVRPDDAHSARYASQVADAVAQPLELSAFADHLHGIAYCPGSITLKPLRGLKREQLLADLEVNYLGACLTLQAAYPLLKARPGSAVVLFSTVAVRAGMSFHASVAGAKGAVEGLTRALAAEWAPDIRVNAVAPSLTDTPLAGSLLATDAKRQAAAERHPLKRVAHADDVAAAAAWLLNPAASHVTGQVIAVDGGLAALR